MDIDERTEQGVTILDLKGKLVLGDGDMLLKDRINSLVFQGRKQILLNLGGLSFMDSAGLGQLVASFTTVNRDGGSLKLVNLTKRIHDLLVIAKLVNIFETFTSESDAVRSFTVQAR